MKSSNTYLFALKEDSHISNEAVKSLFARISRKFGIEKLSPHKLRHYYATNIYQKTTDYFLVSKLLRHKSIEITKRYLDIDDKEFLDKSIEFNPINDF